MGIPVGMGWYGDRNSVPTAVLPAKLMGPPWGRISGGGRAVVLCTSESASVQLAPIRVRHVTLRNADKMALKLLKFMKIGDQRGINSCLGPP